MSFLGKRHTDETRVKMRLAQRIQPRAPSRATILAAVTARKVKYPNGTMYGRKHSEATRIKLSIAAQRRRRNESKEQKAFRIAKQRAALLGKPLSAEHRKKISTAISGRKRPDITGAGNQNWLGGISAQRHGLRIACSTLFEYKYWRSQVFLRDNFTCQGCWTTGRICAHHIRSFKSLVDTYHIETLEQAKACAPLWDIANGITLCVVCHKRIHKGGCHD